MESSSVEGVGALTLLRRQFSSSTQNVITLTPPISEYTLSPQNAEQNRENLYHPSQIQSQQVSTTVFPDNYQMQISMPVLPNDSDMQNQQVSITGLPNDSHMQKQQVPVPVFSSNSQMQKQQVSIPVNINNSHIQKQQVPTVVYLNNSQVPKQQVPTQVYLNDSQIQTQQMQSNLFYYQSQPQFQQPQLHRDQQQFDQYCDNYSYTRTPWNVQSQSSNNYVGSDYYQPAIHGHTSTMQQPAGLYYVPQNSNEYNPFNVNYNLPQGPQLPQGLPRPSTVKPRRTRTFFSPFQLIELEKLFESKKYPSRTERIETSLRLKMTDKQVKVWFQNRRIKLRKVESIGNISPSKSSKRDKTISCKKENADIEDIETINKKIDTEAEAHILQEMLDSTEAEAFEKGVTYMTIRPDEISLILDSADEKLSSSR